MKDNRQGGTCMAKIGLLFLRDCGNPMSRTCIACGRPICEEHAIGTRQGTVCPDCAASEDALQNDPGARFTAQRGRYYSRFGYIPYYYGSTYYYSDGDYRTFDGSQPQTVPPPAGAGAPGASDADDYMES